MGGTPIFWVSDSSKTKAAFKIGGSPLIPLQETEALANCRRSCPADLSKGKIFETASFQPVRVNIQPPGIGPEALVSDRATHFWVAFFKNKQHNTKNTSALFGGFVQAGHAAADADHEVDRRRQRAWATDGQWTWSEEVFRGFRKAPDSKTRGGSLKERVPETHRFLSSRT